MEADKPTTQKGGAIMYDDENRLPDWAYITICVIVMFLFIGYAFHA